MRRYFLWLWLVTDRVTIYTSGFSRSRFFLFLDYNSLISNVSVVVIYFPSQ